MDVHKAGHDHQAVSVDGFGGRAAVVPASENHHAGLKRDVGVREIDMAFRRRVPGDDYGGGTDQRDGRRLFGHVREVSARGGGAAWAARWRWPDMANRHRWIGGHIGPRPRATSRGAEGQITLVNRPRTGPSSAPGCFPASP
jgi:hypothetical protein